MNVRVDQMNPIPWEEYMLFYILPSVHTKVAIFIYFKSEIVLN